jgi:hypothetical protein
MRPALSTVSPAQVGEDEGTQGPPPWSGMMVQRLRGGLDDGMGSGEVDDGAGSREIFGWRLWQPDNVSESLRGAGFANNTQ